MTDNEEAYMIIGKRMANGEPVGEGYLYGREACELISRRLVTQDVMTAYRSGAFLARRATHGETAALAWEAEAKATHEHARLVRAERKAGVA